MASNVTIMNRALTKLGADRILLGVDDTAQARVLNSMFDDVRDAEIRRHHWKFAIKRASIPALVAAPDWGYLYQYPMPADFLALVQVNEVYIRSLRKGVAPWSMEGGNLLTNLAAPLKLRYVSRVTNSGMFDPLFVEAFACKLAWEAAEALTQSSSKKENAQQEYKYALAEAKRMDAMENPPDELPWGGWLDSRMGVGDFGTGDAWQAFPSGTSL